MSIYKGRRGVSVIIGRTFTRYGIGEVVATILFATEKTADILSIDRTNSLNCGIEMGLFATIKDGECHPYKVEISERGQSSCYLSGI